MKLTPSSLALLVVAVTAILTLGAVPALRGTLHYPSMVVTTGQAMRMDFSNYGVTDHQDCEAGLTRQAVALQQNCPTCEIGEKRCITRPSATFFNTLSEDPLDSPSARYAGGVVVFSSDVQDIALAVCRESEKQTAQAAPGQRLRCFAPATRRPRGDMR